jgi:hypothetical protein
MTATLTDGTVAISRLGQISIAPIVLWSARCVSSNSIRVVTSLAPISLEPYLVWSCQIIGASADNQRIINPAQLSETKKVKNL